MNPIQWRLNDESISFPPSHCHKNCFRISHWIERSSTYVGSTISIENCCGGIAPLLKCTTSKPAAAPPSRHMHRLLKPEWAGCTWWSHRSSSSPLALGTPAHAAVITWTAQRALFLSATSSQPTSPMSRTCSSKFFVAKKRTLSITSPSPSFSRQENQFRPKVAVTQ